MPPAGRGLLQALEGAGSLNQRLKIGPIHCRTCRIEPAAFRGSLTPGLFGIRPQRQCGPVRIIQEIVGDQVLEITLAFSDAGFERAQRAIGITSPEWTAWGRNRIAFPPKRKACATASEGIGGVNHQAAIVLSTIIALRRCVVSKTSNASSRNS